MLLGMGGRGFFLLFACAWLFLSPSASWGEFIQERQVDRNFQSGLQDSETGSAFMTSEWAKIPGGLSGMAEYVDGEVLVKFKETTSLYMAEQVCYRKQMSVARRYKALSNKGNGQYMLFRANMSTSEMIEALREDPSVEAVSPNYIRYAYSAPDDPEYPLWGLQKIGAEAAWDINTGSSDVIVANIDSGVDYTHVDLAANMWTNTAETPGDGMDNDGNGYVDDIYGINAIADDGDPMDDNDHGSHTAGTTGAVGDNGKLLTGVNWNVSTMALKFLNAGGTGEDADAIECINYVIDQKNKGQNIVAVNASYGGPGYSEVMKGVISDLGDEGIIFCAAAGNGGNDQIGDNNDLGPSYPDSYDLDNIISVAASNSSDELAGFSNYGVSTVDLAAPGVDILSTIPGFSPRDIFFDDMESGDGNWVHGGTNDSWAITTEEHDNCPSPTHTWSDSPNGDYANDTNAWLGVNQSIDLSAYQEETLYFGFWADYEIESGFDELVIEFSGDGGQGWLSRLNIDGSGPQYYDIEISDGFKINNFKFRFRLKTDSSVNRDGVYIDDVGIGMNSGSNRTASWPGTSMATPHVAGAVALMAAQYPGEDMLTRKNRVLSGVEHIGGLEGKVSTEGRLNLANSIDSNLEFSPLITGSVKDGLVPGSSFTLTGIEFGSSEGEVLFSDNTTDKTAQIDSWSDSSVSGVVPQDAGRYIQINDAAGNSSGIIRGTAWKEMQSAPTALAPVQGLPMKARFINSAGLMGPLMQMQLIQPDIMIS